MLPPQYLEAHVVSQAKPDFALRSSRILKEGLEGKLGVPLWIGAPKGGQQKCKGTPFETLFLGSKPGSRISTLAHPACIPPLARCPLGSQRALSANPIKRLSRRSKRIQTWISKIAQRNFHMNVPVNWPFVCMNKTSKLPYSPTPQYSTSLAESYFYAGHTGGPIIDAVIRQLLKTKYIRNRARMVCVGTDVDPQPCFRLFNPVKSLQFYPHSEYIRTWVGKLKEVHAPSKVLGEEGAKKPLVDHEVSQEEEASAGL
ncbi:DNA photolyase, FAD-binding/Cryptochrome [Tuber indicum]|nr:DNA photolyase, FAD-binding/Cryptochrome [Tuber indicum]